jgi:transcriptional regulator with XRE-family HTH domain
MFNLRAARINQGQSIKEAARQIGVSEGTLRRAERGEGMHPRTLKRIADYYEIRVTDFIVIAEPNGNGAP